MVYAYLFWEAYTTPNADYDNDNTKNYFKRRNKLLEECGCGGKSCKCKTIELDGGEIEVTVEPTIEQMKELKQFEEDNTDV